MECPCGNIWIDGGKAYLRRGGKNVASVEDLSIVEQDGPVIEDSNDDWTTADLFEEEKSA